MNQLVSDKAHTVPQKTPNCGPGLGGLHTRYSLILIWKETIFSIICKNIIFIKGIFLIKNTPEYKTSYIWSHNIYSSTWSSWLGPIMMVHTCLGEVDDVRKRCVLYTCENAANCVPPI